MNQNDLKKYISFTKDILNSVKDNQEYSWFIEMFRNEIVNDFFDNQPSISTTFTSKFDVISEQDISRVKAYLNFIDRKAINFGKEFYKDIKNIELKKSLIKDFKEMKIAIKNDDIIEFGRRLCLQIENIFNYSLSALDIHKLISSNLPHYKNLQPNWAKKPFNFYQSFFDKYGQPVELSKVSFNTKSIFLSIHFGYQINVRNINDLYFLRNKGSHRDTLTKQELQQLNKLLTDFDKNYSFYHRVLFDVVNGIQNI